MDSRNSPPETDAPAVSRRALVGAVGGGTLAATAGCIRQVRALWNRESPSQVSLTIKTAPADADPRAIRIARYLAQRLQTVGVDANITPMGRERLYRDVLLNQQFDVYVAPLRGAPDPDFLRPTLHSRFGAESGRQNPFGYANLDVDAMLERQRTQSGRQRQRTLARIQRSVVRDQPFSVVSFPDEIRVTRSGEYAGWERNPIHTPLGYLGLERESTAETATPGDGPTQTPTQTVTASPTGTEAAPDTWATDTEDSEDDETERLRMTLTDSRPTENLNPIAAEFRAEGTVTGLLYDPLGRWMDGEVRPWLAESWTWTTGGEEGPEALVRLREDVEWHDGEPLTAEDVAFTFEFLSDTSMGRLESPVPAPRFRGLGSLVESTDVLDERTVRLSFVPSSTTVAARAMTAPVLPEHVWESKSTQATVAGLDPNGSVTKALVWTNPQPVGSGPLRFESRQPKASLVLSRNEDHFLAREGLDAHLQPFAGGFGPDELAFGVVPSGGAAVQMVRGDEADATASGVMPADVPEVGRSDELTLHVHQPRTFYQVGYNVRTQPLSSPRFRRTVARLLDKGYLTREVFERYGEPAASPLARHDAVAPALVWNGEDPELPFVGDHGKVNVEQAREQFRQVGYRYSEDGKLLTS